MKRLIFILLLLPSLAWGSDLGQDYARMSPIMLGGGAGADYCASQSWNTFAAFRLDFSHTTANTTACTATGTTAGTLVNAAAGQVSTPDTSTATIGSGGNALVTDATEEYIKFTNTTSIFKSLYGELMFKFNVAGDNAADYRILDINGVTNEDRLLFIVALTGKLNLVWEDNNNGNGVIMGATGNDIDSGCGGGNCYGKWIQVHIKWDTTRCDDGGATEPCDGAGEDEVCGRWRYASAGAWAGPGASGADYWSSWYCETSATNLKPFVTEPDTDDIKFGIVSGTYDSAVWVDDLEISNSQPSW